MTLSTIPLASIWRRPVRPSDLASPGVRYVPGGAATRTMTGCDAVILVNEAEHTRRSAARVGGVMDLRLLDALMNLPHAVPVPVVTLSAREREALRTAPPGVIETNGRTVTRLLTPPVQVLAAVVPASGGWTAPLRSVSRYVGYCQRIVMLPKPPRGLPRISWQADLIGVGVWIRPPDSDDITEIVPPAVFEQQVVKPVRWRFIENAYRTWLLDSVGPVAAPADPHESGTVPLW